METRRGSQLFSNPDTKPKESKEQSSSSPQEKQPCILCGRNEELESLAGELRHDPGSGITVHYHCLYFSPTLVQKDDADKEGDPLVGFKAKDILAEKRRGSSLKCTFCSKRGATVGCCFGAKCRVMFHLPCGRENKTFHEFFGQHRSFCEKHVPELPMERKRRKALAEWTARGHGVFRLICMIQCRICFGVFESCDRRGAVKLTCCPNARFHFQCIQTHALNAGSYYFACPCCKNQELFTKDVLACGVFIPTRDAAWETDNEFADLLIRPNTCSAPGCLISADNNQQHEGSEDAELKVCNTCGSVAVHSNCRTQLKYGLSKNIVVDKEAVVEWTCPECVGPTAIEEPAQVPAASVDDCDRDWR